jgi:hypothetical protein
MLTIDTIPLKNFRFAIAHLRFRQDILQIAICKSKIENSTICFLYAPYGSGSDGKTF